MPEVPPPTVAPATHRSAAREPERVAGLAVYRRPAPGAPRLVLVHGAMDRAGGFVKILRRLPHLDLVRYDRRGYGSSVDAGVHETLEGHVEDLLAVLGDRPATVVGHSLGGLLALMAAERRPDLVRSVGAFEAPLPWRTWWPGGGWGLLEADGGLTEEERAALAAETFLRRAIGDVAWERFPRIMQEARLAEGRALMAELRALDRGEELVRPAGLRVPVLTGHGSHTSRRHRTSAQVVAAEAPLGALQVIEGARHGAHYTHAAEFAAFVVHAVARAPMTPHAVAGAPSGTGDR